jgi:hypothetical protein
VKRILPDESSEEALSDNNSISLETFFTSSPSLQMPHFWQV